MSAQNPNPPAASIPSAPSLGRLKGKVALITGCGNAKGFGAAIARRYVEEGCRVVLADLDVEGAKAVAASLESESNIRVVRMNVAEQASWTTAVETLLKEFGRLDIVVNNAGTTYRNKPSLDVTEEEFQRCFDVNVKSVFWSVKACVPVLQRQGEGGSVINTSSTSAVRPRGGLVYYAASKAAVSNATKALAAEYGADQIRFNAICPLLSGTALFSSFVGVEDTPENREQFWKSIPLQRLTEPVDVANAAVFLASDEAKFITGVDFPVDGGRCI